MEVSGDHFVFTIRQNIFFRVEQKKDLEQLSKWWQNLVNNYSNIEN